MLLCFFQKSSHAVRIPNSWPQMFRNRPRDFKKCDRRPIKMLIAQKRPQDFREITRMRPSYLIFRGQMYLSSSQIEVKKIRRPIREGVCELNIGRDHGAFLTKHWEFDTIRVGDRREAEEEKGKNLFWAPKTLTSHRIAIVRSADRWASNGFIFPKL